MDSCLPKHNKEVCYIQCKTIFFVKLYCQSIEGISVLYSIAKADVRTTTGSNLRNILLQTSLTSVDDLHPGAVKQLKYMEMKDMDMWRIPIIKEALDIRFGNINPPDGWTMDEFDEILNFACTK